MIGGIEETSASSEARSAPRSYPTGYAARMRAATTSQLELVSSRLRWLPVNRHGIADAADCRLGRKPRHVQDAQGLPRIALTSRSFAISPITTQKIAAWSSGIVGKCRGQSPSGMARHRPHPRRQPLMPAVLPAAAPALISSTREATGERRYRMLMFCWQLDASKCSSRYRNLSNAVTLINSGVLRNPERKR